MGTAREASLPVQRPAGKKWIRPSQFGWPRKKKKRGERSSEQEDFVPKSQRAGGGTVLKGGA